MVKTKRAYDPPEISDGDRILVSRGWPRPRTREELAITDWLKILAPSKDLHEDWQDQKISWTEYTIRYHEEMRNQRESIRELAKKAKDSTITLLCFEKENNLCCHRHLLKKLIEREQQRKE
jgi:uncharacterized protein YeaO (DUF488 family)